MYLYIIDYEFIVSTTLRAFLTDLGHEVGCIHSVCDLMGCIESDPKRADVIIVDMLVFNRGGPLREVHQRYPDIALVIMADVGAFLSSDEALLCGVYAYLRKPISLRELELLLVRLGESRKRTYEETRV